MKFYVYYGNHTVLPYAYSCIEADSYELAMKEVRTVTQSFFSYMYDEKQFKQYLDTGRYKDVPLQKISYEFFRR